MLSLLVLHRYFSLQSGQSRITGLVNALSDHFTRFFFCNMRAKTSLVLEGCTIQVFVYDTPPPALLQVRPRRARSRRNTRPTDETSK